MSQVAIDDIKDVVMAGVVKFVCQDLRPFKIVQGEGFLEMADALIRVGARFGENLKARDVFPHPTTISKEVSQVAEVHRRDFKKRAMESAKQGIGISLDIWTDKVRKHSYVNINMHYVDDEMVREHTVCVKPFEEPSKTGDNILKEISGILKCFGLNLHDDITFVTDRGSNIKSALREYVRLDCAAHMVNSIVSKMLRDARNPELEVTLKEARSLVTYAKRSEVQCRLTKTLKAECLTRWNGKRTFSQALLNFDYFSY